MKRPIKVFISSRFEEFEDLRWNLKSELREWTEPDSDVELVMLDDGRADGADASTRSLREISDSDLAVFILGNTYAEFSGDDVSITEMEFDHAVERNSQGVALDFRVWAAPPTDNPDPRATTFLNKAQKQKVVGTLAGMNPREQARQLGNELRTVVAEIQTEFERGIGTTFLDVANEMLKHLSLSLLVDTSATRAEENSRRREFIDHRNHVVETIVNKPDLNWMEEQLNEVHSEMPDDLLTTVLLLLICQHRDRPSDRTLALELADDILNLEERPTPTRNLSADAMARRIIELAALRARVERIGRRALDIRDVVDRLDELETIFRTYEIAAFNRAVLTERVMWGAIHAALVSGSDADAEPVRKKLSKQLIDLFHVYPDFAASLSVSISIPTEVVAAVSRDVHRQLHHSFSMKDNESLPQLLKRVRRYADKNADDISDSVVNLISRRSELSSLEIEYADKRSAITRESETKESQSKLDVTEEIELLSRNFSEGVTEIVDEAHTKMIDTTSLVSSGWGTVEHVDIVEQRLGEELRRAADSWTRLGLPADRLVSTGDHDLAVVRNRLVAIEIEAKKESALLKKSESLLTRFSRSLSKRELVPVATFGLVAIVLAVWYWWMMQGYGLNSASVEIFVETDRAKYLSEILFNFFMFFSVVEAIAVAFVGWSRGGAKGAVVAVVASFVGLASLGSSVNEFVPVVLVALPSVLLVSLVAGLCLYFPTALVINVGARLVTRKTRKSLEVLNTEKSILVGSHDAAVIRDKVLPRIRTLLEEHSRLRHQLDSQSLSDLENAVENKQSLLDALEHDLGQRLSVARVECAEGFQKLKTTLNSFNSQFKNYPAVYNSSYVPRERAAHNDLTRSSANDAAERSDLVMGRKVDRDIGFLAIPINLQRLQELFNRWDQTVQLAEELYAQRQS
jgi:hypothetical protein